VEISSPSSRTPLRGFLSFPLMAPIPTMMPTAPTPLRNRDVRKARSAARQVKAHVLMDVPFGLQRRVVAKDGPIDPLPSGDGHRFGPPTAMRAVPERGLHVQHQRVSWNPRTRSARKENASRRGGFQD